MPLCGLPNREDSTGQAGRPTRSDIAGVIYLSTFEVAFYRNLPLRQEIACFYFELTFCYISLALNNRISGNSFLDRRVVLHGLYSHRMVGILYILDPKAAFRDCRHPG